MFNPHNPNTPVFHVQNHPRWAKVKVGTSNTTIAQVGCLLCCLASIVSTRKTYIEPHVLNFHLTRKGLYVKGNRLVFDCLGDFDVHLYAVGTVNKQKHIIEKVGNYFQVGYDVVLEIGNLSPMVPETHWVWVVDLKDNDFWVFDPLTPPYYDPVQPLMPYFGTPFLTPELIVTRYAVYYCGGSNDYEKKCVETPSGKGY